MIELLVVIAIIALMTALTMQSFQSYTRSFSLTTASAYLRDGLELARQTAVSKNSTVEVRFYQLPASSSSTLSGYCAFQAFLKGNLTPPTYTAITAIIYFPRSIVLSTDSTKTSFLTLSGQPAAGSSPPSSATPISLPTCGTNYNYLYFCYTPSGGTNLSPTGSWFATLVPENAPTSTSNGGLPTDFATVQVDPVMGNARVYHP
ncbi:MAG: Verru_Chthon cassette protein D [Methylacidiphilales bacterium]|nr:Verru_Chthon cassette protein D [Candidatus Methylacidiphilales bacterium]